jgi:hypothetical protein
MGDSTSRIDGQVAQPLRLPFRVAYPLKFRGPGLEFPRNGWKGVFKAYFAEE